MISVIMPTYNSAGFIHSAIESVLNQTLRDWELLVVNDGSSDNTEEIVKSFKDPRILYFYQENRGVGAARNIGLKNMTGEFFCFLDADDRLPSKSIEARYSFLKQHPEIDFADGHVHIYNEALTNRIGKWKPSYAGSPLNQLLQISISCFFSPTWMIRRKKNTIYRFNETLTHGEDLLFYIDLALEGGIYDFVDEVILDYRKGHTSAMKNLKGLENGYKSIYTILKKNDKIPVKQVETFGKLAKKIVFKSYLGKYQIPNALKSMFKKW